MDPGEWTTQRVQTGQAFDLAVSKQLGDDNRHYVDGQTGFLRPEEKLTEKKKDMRKLQH